MRSLLLTTTLCLSVYCSPQQTLDTTTSRIASNVLSVDDGVIVNIGKKTPQTRYWVDADGNVSTTRNSVAISTFYTDANGLALAQTQTGRCIRYDVLSDRETRGNDAVLDANGRRFEYALMPITVDSRSITARAVARWIGIGAGGAASIQQTDGSLLAAMHVSTEGNSSAEFTTSTDRLLIETTPTVTVDVWGSRLLYALVSKAHYVYR